MNLNLETFTIIINESQREHLTRALRVYENTRTSELLHAPSDPTFGDGNALADVRNLIDMLEELPTLEDTHNVSHGLCY